MQPLVHSRLRDDIVARLAELIATGELGEVERLKEVELAARLGVSRTPLREALLVLEREGLVVSEAHKGFRVAALSEARVRELYPILGSLEALAVREGGRALRDRAGELNRINTQLRKSRGNARRHALDRRFHECLWSGSENTTLVELLRRLWRQAQQFDGAAERGMANPSGSVAEHAKIAEAIGRGELDRAAHVLEAHWRSGIEVVVGWLRRRGAAALVPLLALALWPACAPRSTAPHAVAEVPAAAAAPHVEAAPRTEALVPAPPGKSALTQTACPSPADDGVECFTLMVPAHRTQPDGALISIPVIRVRSRATTPADPVIFLTGGPGGNAIPSRLIRGPIEDFLADRDYIVFQQRGGQLGTPDLSCPEYAAAHRAIWSRNLAGAAAVALQRDAAAACARRLRAQGVDLDAYDTAAIVDDLFDLQRALGLTGFHLYGISYGTLVALEAVRRAPSPSPIRSVVLDSVLPPDVRYDEHATDNVLRALHRVLDQCAIDPACAKAYPRLRARWTAALARAQRTPIPAMLTPPDGGAQVRVRLTARNLFEAATAMLESAADIPSMPRVIDDIVDGRLERVLEHGGAAARPPSFTFGQRLSIWCRDEAAVIDWAAVTAQTTDHPELGDFATSAFAREVCAAWAATPSTAVHTAVTSDVPALVLAGEYDPVTPPEWGRRVVRTLARGFFVELPGMTHVAGWNGCGRTMILAFLRDPSRMPDSTCAARAAPAFEPRREPAPTR
jgi:DNA-binding GntR family transcriptional regulator/pimeloyl-ACP methyl ester carboxylesterase